jgi:hypothetical protein
VDRILSARSTVSRLDFHSGGVQINKYLLRSRCQKHLAADIAVEESHAPDATPIWGSMFSLRRTGHIAAGNAGVVGDSWLWQSESGPSNPQPATRNPPSYPSTFAYDRRSLPPSRDPCKFAVPNLLLASLRAAPLGEEPTGTNI